jgi:hypothetical protein
LGFKGVYLAGVIFHLLLVLTVSCRDTFSVLSQGHTIFPTNLDSSWREAESVTTAVIGQDLSKSNPLRQGLGAYLNAAGIEADCGSFALVNQATLRQTWINYEIP